MVYEPEVRFMAKSGKVILRFNDTRQALAYRRNARPLELELGGNPQDVILPHAKDLEYVRPSNSTHDLVFVFVNPEAAEDWSKHLPLVIRNNDVVQIPRNWSNGELNDKLGVGKAVLGEMLKPKGRDGDIDPSRRSKLRSWHPPSTS